eukprot:1180594-Prorocentrum_minimum.AAC.2
MDVGDSELADAYKRELHGFKEEVIDKYFTDRNLAETGMFRYSYILISSRCLSYVKGESGLYGSSRPYPQDGHKDA